MDRTFSLCLILCLSFASCYSTFKGKTTHQQDIDYLFDRGMQTLVNKYQVIYRDKFSISDSLSFSKRFKSTKRTSLPQFKNLTLDFRSFKQCEGCWDYKIAAIYNDSIFFILPLTDDEYYWQISSEEVDALESDKCTNFIAELNNLITALKCNKHDTEILLKEIMTNRGFNRIGKDDVPKLKSLAQGIATNSFYNLACRSNIKENVAKTEAALGNKDNVVYSDGVNIYIFSINDQNKIAADILNTTCNKMLLY